MWCEACAACFPTPAPESQHSVDTKQKRRDRKRCGLSFLMKLGGCAGKRTPSGEYDSATCRRQRRNQACLAARNKRPNHV